MPRYGRQSKRKEGKPFLGWALREMYEDLRSNLPPVKKAQGAEEIKRQLLETVEAAVDERLNDLREGQGLSILFRIDLLNEDGTFFGEGNQRHSQQAKEWRKKVFERDAYTCRDCHQYGGKLQAHHLEEWAEHPDKRFDLSNGVTLCVECHAKRHPDRANLIRNARYFDGKAVTLRGRDEEAD